MARTVVQMAFLRYNMVVARIGYQKIFTRMNAVFVALLIALISPLPTQKAKVTDPIVEKINAVRQENKLAPLSIDKALTRSAQTKACDLKERNYWSHYTPDGKSPFVLFQKSGYDYHYAGENLARRCQELVCVDLWLASPSHRENILRSVYRDIGVGRCGGFTVIHFGAL